MSSVENGNGKERSANGIKVEIIESLTATCEKMKAEKYDSNFEKYIVDWVFTFLEKPREDYPNLHTLLKDGVILCEIINKITPTAISINRGGLAFKQMENIEKYIKCCGRLGLNSVNLFNTIDLYEGKDMGVVLNNLHVLSQQIAKNDMATLATLLNTLSVPVAKEPTTTSQTNSFKLGRRSTHIESPPGGSPVLGSSPTTALFNPFQATSKPPAHVATLQDDLFVKEEMKYNPELERQAKNWIEALLDVTFPANESLISLLKPGVILCKIMNAIEAMGCKNVTVPTFPKIYDGGIAYKQMENIEQYKQACEKLGLKQTDLFVTSDLFEEKNINNVITHIHFFAKFVQKWEGYTGPIMEDSSKVRNLFSETLVVADAPETRLQGNMGVVVQTLTPEQQELVNWVNMKLSRPHSRRLGSLVAFSNVKTPPQSPSSLRHSSSNSDINDAPISRITNLGSDFRSGVVLIRLLEIVTKLSVGAYEKEPRIVWHFMVNASLALRFLSTQACCKVVCCSSQDIVMGREDKITALISFIRDRYDLEYLFMKELKKDGDVQFDDNELRTFGFKQLGNRGSARDDGKKHKKRHHRSGSSGSSSSISRHKRSSSTAAVPAESSRKDKKSKKEKKPKRGSSTMTPVVTEHDETKRQRLMAAQNAVRLRVAQELLETERSYYHSLSQLNKYLIQPVKKANVLTTQEFDRMFSNIEFIVDGHGKLLQRLETVMASWSETSSIAPIFANTAGFFHDYAQYCANYNNALVYSYFLPKSNPTFAKALDQFATSQLKEEGASLPNILIMPVQRIPRYVLLLTDMRKYTNQRHIDYEDLSAVVDEIKTILETINSKMSQHQTLGLAKLIYVLDVIDGVDLSTFLRPNSVYIREGVLTLSRVQSMKDRRQSIRETISTAWRGKRKQTYYWFLFDDVLVSCDQKKEDGDKPFIFVATLPLMDVQSVAEKEGSVLMLMMENEIWKIKAPSEHEKQAWMTDLRTATQGVKKKKRGTAIIAHSNLVVPHGGASTQPPQPTNNSKEKKEKEKERN